MHLQQTEETSVQELPRKEELKSRKSLFETLQSSIMKRKGTS